MFASTNGIPVPDTTHASYDLDPNNFDNVYFTSEIVVQDAYSPPTRHQSLLGSTLGSPDSLDLLDHSLTDSYTLLAPSLTPPNAPIAKRPLVQSKLPFKSIPVTEWWTLELAKEQKKKARCESEHTCKYAQCAHQKALQDSLLD
ncbi:hypothetical protein FRC09_005672 [Ceratobasidium sp. 395]|nr:hypothetical protein FRC09_005672 [Ceratobasidium sp. 395]